MSCTPNVVETKVVYVQNGARGPAGPSPDNLTFVDSLLDLPAAEGGVRRVPEGSAYFFTKKIDLAGDRFVCDGVAAFLGTSSETAGISSTGLIDTPLITSTKTLPIQNLEIVADYAVNLQGDGSNGVDWKAVNFVNTRKVGEIRNYSNFIMTDSAFLSSGGLTFGGTIGTIGIDGSLFSLAEGLTGISFEADAVVTRRFRIIYSSFVSLLGCTAINIPETVTIPVEGYILETVNFAGPGNYLSGIQSSSNFSLFSNCTNIPNTKVAGQMYVRDNTLPTTIPSINTFVKILANPLPSDDNEKYEVSGNRLICRAVIPRRYLIQASVSFTSGNNNIISLGFYDSKLGAIREPSVTRATANSGGRAENITFQCVVEHSEGDYIELWAANGTSTSAIVATDFNVLSTAL